MRPLSAAVAPGVTAAYQWLLDWRVRVNGSHQYRAPSQLPWHSVIPPQIFQLSYRPDEELAANGVHMRRWWELNPDWHYHLFSESDCLDFVRLFGNPKERAAYACLKLGAQRADLCRVHLLLRVGGVYADADVEPRQSLRGLLPTNASAVRIPLLDGAAWPFTFLAFAAAHPIMRTHADSAAHAVLGQLQHLRSQTKGCSNEESCVLALTGPFAFATSISRTFQHHLCAPQNETGTRMAWPCRSSHDEQMRGTFLARTPVRDATPLVHHHCRRYPAGVGERACDPKHYSSIRSAADAFLLRNR